jgi:hypothetical protein
MTQTPTAPKPSDVLVKAATQYAAAKAGDMVTKVGNRAAGNGQSKQNGDNGENGENGEDKKGFLGSAAEKLGEGASPVKAAVSGVGTSIKEGVKGLFSRKGGSKRPHNIVEDIIVGVTPDVCWAAFTQWEEFPSFMKGPVEWMGQRWHTVGKRVRLDMKHFRRYVMRTEPDELPEPEEPEEQPDEQPTDETPEEPTDEESAEEPTDEAPEDATEEEPEEPEADEPEDEPEEPESEPEPEMASATRSRPARRPRG